MNRPSVIYLVNETYSQNQYGVQTTTQTIRKAYADVSSVTGREWFEGGRNGLNPQFRMRVFHSEYKGEKVLVYEGVFYTIYRTFMDGDVTELYVEKRKGNENDQD